MRIVAGVLAVSAFLMLLGCVGSPVHSTIAYNSVQSEISHNNENLLALNIGMTKQQVLEKMDQPATSEGYTWGSAWLYRTAMKEGIGGGIYGTAEGDFTPLVFDGKGKLTGWGRNFFEDHVKRYEIKIE